MLSARISVAGPSHIESKSPPFLYSANDTLQSSRATIESIVAMSSGLTIAKGNFLCSRMPIWYVSTLSTTAKNTPWKNVL